MKKFEAVILFSPDLSSSVVSKEEEKFTKTIESKEGKILNKENWGLRNLKYNIKNFKKAFYNFYQIEINGSELKDIKRNITQNEKILRHLFVNVLDHQKLPTKMVNNEEK